MTQHRHTIPKGANQTASVTDPDLTPYAKTGALISEAQARMDGDSAIATAMALLAGRVTALEHSAPTPPTTKSVPVTSIPTLLSALADDTVDEIVLANGTYLVDGATAQTAKSLYIGAAFASRTRPILVRAATTGGVILDGGGMTYFDALAFEGGAHDQTWQGFTFAHGTPTQTGVILFGGYAGLAAPHHITLRDIAIAGSVVSTGTGATDHAIYFAQAVGGPHDILIDGYTVDGSGGVNTALHFYHSDASNRNAWNVTVKNMTVTGTREAVVLWDPTLLNILIEDSTITGAIDYAVRYETVGASGIILRNVVSTASGGKGFYSSEGLAPAGVTFDGCSLA